MNESASAMSNPSSSDLAHSSLADKDYLVVVQCHIVAERCSGYYCERAFHDRTGGFAACPADKPVRMVSVTCGGCCGRALQRKISNLLRCAGKDGIPKERVGVQFASCITKDNHHAPPCPHRGYLRKLVEKLGLDSFEDTHISKTSQRRREEGLYRQ